MVLIKNNLVVWTALFIIYTLTVVTVCGGNDKRVQYFVEQPRLIYLQDQAESKSPVQFDGDVFYVDSVSPPWETEKQKNYHPKASPKFMKKNAALNTWKTVQVQNYQNENPPDIIYQ